ncbi:hypothetical protein LJC32_05040 [Oscillospiraceae bacterium OttesenSCG-928-F05]|nr:hypothetical protein [Oscillospiraceae bacterium OttesenSCG-928-F05]
MRKHIVLPALALVLGVLSGVFRGFERLGGFELETGLPIPGHWSFFALCAAVFFSLLILCAAVAMIKTGKREVEPNAFVVPGKVSRALGMVAGLFLIAAAVLSFATGGGSRRGRL